MEEKRDQTMPLQWYNPKGRINCKVQTKEGEIASGTKIKDNDKRKRSQGRDIEISVKRFSTVLVRYLLKKYQPLICKGETLD